MDGDSPAEPDHRKQRMRNYWKSHFSVRLTAIFIAVLLLVAFAFQRYLQNQYLEYLVAVNAQSDSVVLDVESDTIARELTNDMQTGATASLDQDLTSAAWQ